MPFQDHLPSPLQESIRSHSLSLCIRELTLCKVILVLNIIIAIIHRIVCIPVVFIFKVIVVIVPGVLQTDGVRSNEQEGDRAGLTSIMKSSSSDIVDLFQVL
jgi:hypothetical protein